MRSFNKILSFFLIAVAISCATQRNSINSDFAYLYKKETFTLHPKYIVHHTSNETSDLYFSIDSKELLYNKQLNENDFTARVELSYLVVLSADTKVTIDSGTIRMNDINNDNIQKMITGNVKIKLPSGKDYTFSLVLNDINKKTYSETILDVDKSTNSSAMNYLLRSKDGNTPLFKNYLQPDEDALIVYREPVQRLYVKYYKKDFLLPAPPFSVMDVRPLGFRTDSTLILQPDENGKVPVKLYRDGIYFLQADTNASEGLTLFRYYKNFPEVALADQLLEPLRYLTSKSEYDDMSNSKNKKISVENFWINCAGNKDRAREVIKKFYTRVADANQFFSSYLEGWKTDRGMIYLVYGPANYIYKNNSGETWVYGDPNNLNALQFNFFKVENVYSENDYTLERSVIYKSSWYRAVDIWRQGRIYLQN